MLNFGWAEMLVIGVVALIVIGPDDLPDMFRQLGRFTGKLRAMSREFSRAMEQAAKDTGVKDVARDLRNVTSPKAMGLDAVKSAADKFEKWDPMKNAAKPTVPAALGAKPLTPPPMPMMPQVTTKTDAPEAEDLDEELADLDLIAEEEAPALRPGIGPETQALYDKKAMRAQVLAEQAAKLKAIEAGTYQAEVAPAPAPVPEPTPAPASKPKRAARTAPKVAAVAATEVKTAAKPRKTVKKADPS